MRPAIDVKGSRQQFDFVAEKIECDRAREISQVLELDLAERRRFFRKIEYDRARGVRCRLAVENNSEICDAQFRLVDEDRRSARGPGCECDLPRTSPRPKVLVEREAADVDHQ